MLVARHLLPAEVFIRARAIKAIVGHLRRDLRDADVVILKITEHLIRLARHTVADDTARRPEEQQRPALFILGQRIPLAAREPIDRRVGEGQRELKFGDRFGEHIERDWCAGLDLWKAVTKQLLR